MTALSLSFARHPLPACLPRNKRARAALFFGRSPVPPRDLGGAP